ncbi:hypothetical protein A2U01_0096563, partial [Trifolium medium]|nr:hypothetical protein [Trifolium medium]
MPSQKHSGKPPAHSLTKNYCPPSRKLYEVTIVLTTNGSG